MKTIEVPVSWFEGLQSALAKCDFLRDDNQVDELNYLLGYLDSIKEFLKK